VVGPLLARVRGSTCERRTAEQLLKVYTFLSWKSAVYVYFDLGKQVW
jgi:hypothetical protein